MRLPSLSLVVLVAAACSSEPDGGGAGGVDAAAGPVDAPVQAASCLVAPELGDLGMRTGTPMASGATGSKVVAVSVTVATEGTKRDAFFLQLKGGKGAFAGRDPEPGTYTIGGADAVYGTCGVCVTLIGDIVAGQGPSQFYFATSGTVTITQAAGRLTGSVRDLRFGELNLNDGSLVAGGCTSHVAGVQFDVALP